MLVFRHQFENNRSHATAVNASGVVLGRTSAEPAVWSTFGQPDWRAGERNLTAITEEGDLYGTASTQSGSRAIKLACVNRR